MAYKLAVLCLGPVWGLAVGAGLSWLVFVLECGVKESQGGVCGVGDLGTDLKV